MPEVASEAMTRRKWGTPGRNLGRTSRRIAKRMNIPGARKEVVAVRDAEGCAVLDDGAEVRRELREMAAVGVEECTKDYRRVN